MNPVTRSVLRALDTAPCSWGTLARAAGVSPANLFNARAGEREVSAAVALALASALDRWSARCQRAARDIRRAVGAPAKKRGAG